MTAMARTLAPYVGSEHGKRLMGAEPLVFHCNYYNYFLQKTLLLDEELAMHEVIADAAAESSYALLSRAARDLGLTTPEARRHLAESTFAELGFGLIDLSAVTPEGGIVRIPVSHYGRCLRVASGADFARPQSYFDAGFAAAATSVIHGIPLDSVHGVIEACQSMGAPEGRIAVTRRTTGKALLAPCGQGGHWPGTPVGPNQETSVDEAAILAALATLDFAGNEEGLVPRFGVILTNHFANFYNRISFEFVHRMKSTGLMEAAEALLVEAGLRCAFHTFGGIMTSLEWDAVIKPQCKTREDWIHGMVATVNALGWGVWRIHELTADRIVIRAYDDYESSGWVGMYGKADRPVSYLLAGGVAGIMNLVHVADITNSEKPTLDADCYERVFESESRFTPRQTKSMAMGDDYSEIIAER